MRLDVLAVRCEDASLLKFALPNVPDCLAGPRTGDVTGTLFSPLPLCRLCSLLRPTRADIPAANWSKVRFLLPVDGPTSLGAGTAGGTTTGAAFDFDVEFVTIEATCDCVEASNGGGYETFDGIHNENKSRI